MITAFATQGAATEPTLGGSLVSMLVSLLPMILIFYFILIRPQRKQQKKMQNMLDALQMDDKVVTIGGIMGKVVKIKPEEVVIETGSGPNKCQIKFQKSAISKVLTIHE